MSDFRLNCDRLLAVTREHFFASDEEARSQDDPSDDEPTRHFGDAGHRALNCA